ncbi:MAG TPA: PIN domain-containing protein [Acidobacteriota bacterium]|nr:PIN domain-containing protein [Acidobacteriota bacterium]
MATNAVLVDSSYYIRMLRQGKDPLQALAFTAATRDLAVCGLVQCEVGRGLLSRSVLETFHAFWSMMIYVHTDERLWRSVEDTLWRLDRRGIILPLTDVVIGCCARSIGAAVLTADRHFSYIAGIDVIDRPD